MQAGPVLARPGRPRPIAAARPCPAPARAPSPPLVWAGGWRRGARPVVGLRPVSLLAAWVRGAAAPPPGRSAVGAVARSLAAQRQRPLAGPYYGAVLAALEEGISLPAAWRQGFAALSGEGGRILRRLEPEGDEQRILGELTWAAGELTELRRRLEQESRQREKLWFAGLFSGAGLLLILLI